MRDDIELGQSQINCINRLIFQGTHCRYTPDDLEIQIQKVETIKENIKNLTPISVVTNEFIAVDPEKPWEQDVRFLKDVAAGCNPYEAIKKYKRRMRAVEA